MLKLLSYVDLYVQKIEKIQALNVFLEHNIKYLSIKADNCGNLTIRVYSWQQKRIEKLLNDSKICYNFSSSYGALSKIIKNSHRVGILLGFVITMFALIYSQNIIWRIDIKGNNTVESEKIINALEKEGIYLGKYIPSIDYDTVHNRFLLNNQDFSWISVNINGNIATVNVRETISHELKSEPAYTNIVASMDGQIALISVIDGEKQVSIGDVVKKGDLLISGIVDSKSEGVRLTTANGEVFAYVNKQIFVKIPLKNTKKVYTGNTYTEKSYKIYKKYIKLFKKHSNCSGFCDTIEENKQITVFGSIKLPIKVKSVVHYEYENIDFTYTTEEAVDLALKDLRIGLDTALENAELVSKEIQITSDKENVYLECNICCIEDIAEGVEFYVN